MTPEILAFIMFGSTLVLLLAGFPVALTLGGTALLFAYLGDHLDLFRMAMMNAYPLRLLGVMKSEPLVAIPLFVFMGVMLEQSQLAGRLLETMGRLFGRMRGGLGISVVIVGALLAASTGIAGATVVTMGLISLPVMLRSGYSPALASGLICSSGTLGQIIPPSIVLVLLADILQGANEQAAQISGTLVPEPVTAIDLFAGALLPGLMLVGLYLGWVILMAIFNPSSCPSLAPDEIDEADQPSIGEIAMVIAPPLILIVIVLGSILMGVATPTESASVGAIGATLLALQSGSLNWKVIRRVGLETTKISSMVFVILIGASMFSLVFRGFGGDEVIEHFLANLPGGPVAALLLVMAVMFFLGFFLDFIEIIF
ncbi:MAG: TRAP transporter large permease subunit, partial [Pseudomonadota bacterium]